MGNCKQCNKIFKKHDLRHMFCSKDCYLLSVDKNIIKIKICLCCSNSFQGRGDKYCSEKCREKMAYEKEKINYNKKRIKILAALEILKEMGINLND